MLNDKLIITKKWVYERYQANGDIDHINNLEIPNLAKNTILGDCIFQGCESLVSVTLPKSASVIGECSFFKCTKLRTINFSPALKKIGFAAFYNTAVKKIIFPKALGSIDDLAFADCYDLEEVIFNGIPMSISKNAFAGCTKLHRDKIHFPRENAYDSLLEQIQT